MVISFSPQTHAFREGKIYDRREYQVSGARGQVTFTLDRTRVLYHLVVDQVESQPPPVPPPISTPSSFV